MAKMLKEDSILITGGTGFVGSHLVEALQTKGQVNIHVTSTKPAQDTEVTTHTVDLTKQEQTFELFKLLQPKWIFHLASYAIVSNSFENQSLVCHQNALIQENVLEAVRLYTPAARFLNVSSGEIYGKSLDASELPITETHVFRPTNPYAVSKIYQDSLAYMYAFSHGIPIIRARPFNHIGERQSNKFVVAAIAEQIAKIERGLQENLVVGNTQAIRDFTDVKDVVEAYILLIQNGVPTEAYNIGSSKGYSIEEIISLLSNHSTRQIPVVVDSDRLRPSDIPVMIAHTQKMRNLGWQPSHSLEQTLQRILEFWRKSV